jgi:hypothetical protein
MKKKSNFEKLLRKQFKGEEYIYFINFLGSYLYQGLTWAEVPTTIKLDIDASSTEYKSKLLKELKILEAKNDWKFIEDFVDEHSGKGYSEEQLKQMFQWLIDGLTADKESGKWEDE